MIYTEEEIKKYLEILDNYRTLERGGSKSLVSSCVEC